MGLLHADLRSLANLPATAAGRRVVTGTLFGLGMLALIWWSMSFALLEARRFGGTLQELFGTALMPCPIVATWLGLSLAQRQLFETPELTLWRLAPVPGWRAPIQVLLRAAFFTFVWAAAMSLPFVFTLLSRATPAPILAWLLVPFAVLCCTVPLLCTILAIQIVLVRFFSGPLLRLVLASLAALASVGFSAWLLVGLFAQSGARPFEPTAPLAIKVPWIVDTSAALLAAAAAGRFDTLSLRAALGWLGLTISLFWFVARLHPRAVERHLESSPPALRRRTAWPANLAAVIRRKEFAQVLQQPGALIGFLLFGLLVYALVDKRVLVASMLADRRVQPDLACLGAMLLQWFLAVLLVLYAHMGRLALWDGPQWSLYMTAPASPWPILRGKLSAIGLLLLWPLLLVGAFGSRMYGASTFTLVTFVGVAVGGTFAALGVLAIVGTSPRLMRPDDGGQIVQGGRSFLAALLLVVMFELVMSPGIPAWFWLSANVKSADAVRGAGVWIVGSAWVLGLVVAAVGVAVGSRNFRRLSAAP